MFKDKVMLIILVGNESKNFLYWVDKYNKLRKMDIEVNFIYFSKLSAEFEFVSSQNLIFWDGVSISTTLNSFFEKHPSSRTHVQFLTTNDLIESEILHDLEMNVNPKNIIINNNKKPTEHRDIFYDKKNDSNEDGIEFRNEFSFKNTLFPISIINKGVLNYKMNNLKNIAEILGIYCYSFGSKIIYSNYDYMYYDFESKDILPTLDNEIESLKELIISMVPHDAKFPPVIHENAISSIIKNIQLERNAENDNNIVFCCDENLLDYAFFNIYNIHSQTKSKIRFNLIISSTNEFVNEKVKVFQNKFTDINITIFDFSTYNFPLFSPSREQKHVSDATYMRLYLASILECKKVLYLDVDTFVLGDINKLFEEYKGMSGNFARVSREFKSINNRMNYDFVINNLNSINNRLMYKYVNAGVVIFDLEYLRSSNSVDEMIEYCANNSERLFLADQDVLNSVCIFNDLNPIYNIGSSIWKGKVEINSTIKIIHFFSNAKPWKGHGNIVENLLKRERFSMSYDDYKLYIPYRNAWISRFDKYRELLVG